jgi:hypothetical protein
VRSVIADLGGLPRLLKDELRAVGAGGRFEAIAGSDRSPADIASDLAGLIERYCSKAIKDAFRKTLEGDQGLMSTVLYVIMSGTRVSHPTRLMSSRADKTFRVEDFDGAGLFGIEVAAPYGTFRLTLPQLRLDFLRDSLGRDIPGIRNYKDLVLFPSFKMAPDQFEALVPEVIAARLNALYRTQHAEIVLGALLPGCKMHAKTERLCLNLTSGDVQTERESRQAVDRLLLGKRVLSRRVWINGTPRQLEETTDCVLRCYTGMDHIDARVVLKQADKYSLKAAHIAIQCKSGETGSRNAMDLHNKAMAFMRPVKDLRHFYVLASPFPAAIELPDDAAWPESLIVVRSFREFAPLLANYVDFSGPRRLD